MSNHSQGARWVLPVLSVAAFMASLDLFIVNVAFDAIGRDFSGGSLGDLSWILNATRPRTPPSPRHDGSPRQPLW
jgi:hypothetical protein